LAFWGDRFSGSGNAATSVPTAADPKRGRCRDRRISIKWKASPARVMFDVHNATGILSALFLLPLSLTGIAMWWNKRRA
jgi:uncharacterized iron-regulated membrane protein